jgi:MoxR-like ATPase
MNNEGNNWRQELATWLEHRPRTMPDDLRQLREDFLKRFPMETLGSLTLEQYAGGKRYDGFCYWLETKTRKLGSISGGSSAKFGVYLGGDNAWHYNIKTYQSVEDALVNMKNGLVALTTRAQKGELDALDELGARLLGPNRYVLRSKPLYLYFPQTFIPCFNKAHLQHFLEIFGVEPQANADLLALDRQLLAHLRTLPEFSGFDTQQMMTFLYDCCAPEVKPTDPAPEVEIPAVPDEDTQTLSQELQQLVELAQRTRNILLYGPPGTGKTYVVHEFASRFLRSQQEYPFDHYYTLVTFHQSFAYEEFVEELKPRLSESSPLPDHQPDAAESSSQRRGGANVEYSVVPGIFKRACLRAEADWHKYPENTPKYILVIDEMNRANIAKVFGELLTLIEDDKRLGQAHELRVNLPYSGERFGVPPNLYILGTMNTADRSIALLDLALRRRFAFMEVMPDPTLLNEQVGEVDLQKLLKRLNQRIAAVLDRDHQIGHSYLMNVHDGKGLRFAWYYRIVPLLQEYFYQDGERLQAVLGKRFVTREEPDSHLFDGEEENGGERPLYCIQQFEGDDHSFLTALKQLAGL